MLMPINLGQESTSTVASQAAVSGSLSLKDVRDAFEKVREQCTVRYISSPYCLKYDQEGQRVYFHLADLDVIVIHPDLVAEVRTGLQAVGWRLEECDKDWWQKQSCGSFVTNIRGKTLEWQQS